jgi:YcxB-like protein
VEIEYRVEEGDVLAFLDHHSEHSAAAREIRRRQTYGYAILLAILGLVLWFFGETALVIAFLVLGPVWVAWWPARARRLARKQAAALYREGPNPMFDGPHVLRLDEGGIVAIAPGAESRLPFTSVQRVVDTPDYLFVYVGAIQAFVVPRRRVARGDVRAFAEQLRRRLTQRSP